MKDEDKGMEDEWLALGIGNSRWHWARFLGNELWETWDSPALDRDGLVLGQGQEVWVASVVPEQSDRWQDNPQVRWLTLEQVPLRGLYPTLGIDRALAVWGAIAQLGAPILVIDAGTALTFTGADQDHRLVGGAILPGLRLQLQSLHQGTAELPAFNLQQSTFSLQQSRWARDTPTAIASGVIHTLLAGIQSFIMDWWRLFPGSPVVLTGGDGDRLYGYLQQSDLEFSPSITHDPNLIFWGIQTVRAMSR